MVQITPELLREIVRTIVREIHPEKVILFGSYARGNARPDSDMDFLVVMGRPFGLAHNRRKEISKIRRALSKYPIPKDILVYSQDEIEKWRDSLNHIISHCLKEGKLLYERS